MTQTDWTPLVADHGTEYRFRTEDGNWFAEDVAGEPVGQGPVPTTPEQLAEDVANRIDGLSRKAVLVAMGHILPSYSVGELRKEEFKLTWLTKGFWSHPSHGMWAGKEKTLKSWLSAAMAVSVAAGKDFLGEFPVVTSGPVVIFTGESGRFLYERRINRIGHALGMSDADIDKLPIHIIDKTATTPVQWVDRTGTQ